MTSRKVQRYHQRVKNMTEKQSRRIDYDDGVYRNARSARPLVLLLTLVVVFWTGVTIWAIREVF